MIREIVPTELHGNGSAFGKNGILAVYRALEPTKISDSSKSNQHWQVAILIVALFTGIPAWARTHDQGMYQSIHVMANLATNLKALVRTQIGGSECGTSDFTFHALRAQSAGYGFTRITGRISNNCAEAKGAQIKITTYNRAGDILSDNDFWPASIDNIPANSEFPFEWLHTKVVFAKFTVTIISVKSWPEALARHFPLNRETANTLTPSN
jgi:hypothetical protein